MAPINQSSSVPHITNTLGVDGVEGGHFVVISIAADLSVPDSSNAFRHSVSDSNIASAQHQRYPR